MRCKGALVSRLKEQHLKLCIDSKLESVAFMGAMVRAVASDMGFDDRSCFHVELAVIEAVNNAIDHAYRFRPEQQIIVLLNVREREIEFEVQDWGIPMPSGTLENALPSTMNGTNLSEGGRGLAIIQQIMDRVAYERRDGQNILRMTKRRPA